MTKKVLITGKNGQLGSELQKYSQVEVDFHFVFLDRQEMPLENKDAILKVLNTFKPNVIINAGAYTAVDKAEEEKEVADLVNHQALRVIAEWCNQNSAKLIHISTDYVFDGNSDKPYKENDITDPINWYGETKLLGEKAVSKQLNNAIIIRTSWVYSASGNNFVKTMLNLMKNRDQISVVNDQIGSPTWAADLANAILTIIKANKWIPGIYHFSNSGKVSWHGYAKEIQHLVGLACNINAVDSTKFPTKAKRPKYSLLDTTKIERLYDIKPPHWKKSLKEFLSNNPSLLNKES
ncbi:dTDP-4-dehydrorhamnose reductase [Brumimicrobium salinarum]|uniref:dTDP-4-dehydrorhamnose reductase n=1 Tax=Brumimicrobium salinarum TaxID=2058658 RepID=A0A2I0R155_9FLAO|nr:dTDP-4-dehydrorhamnose reductase [Brumimicrobium salinarum]PKR80306.1 dTDP-4-dehydrorhamnose reductase [Brumimicrobium salinarum]